MDANESPFVHCHDGLFFIPEELIRSLESLVTNGFVYLRQDCDTLTISATPMSGGQRRLLTGRVRAAMFRGATELAIVNLRGALQVMAVV